MNFEKILFCVIIAAALIVLLHKIFSRHQGTRRPWYVDYAASLLPVLIVIFVLRSFVIEPFVIPSQSMEPTLKIGDFILVNKFAYGLRLPILNKEIWHRVAPKVGDIVVFHYPGEANKYYIKRIVAGPGDTIAYEHKQLILNGKKVPLKLLQQTYLREAHGQRLAVDLTQEQLPHGTHEIYLAAQLPSAGFNTRKIPQGMYFLMGDNRDNSHDSRAWGLLPVNDIVGRAFIIWMSVDNHHWQLRWQRLGAGIH